jgi:hypothetical protein
MDPTCISTQTLVLALYVNGVSVGMYESSHGILEIGDTGIFRVRSAAQPALPAPHTAHSVNASAE